MLVKLTYCKESGRYYTQGEIEMEQTPELNYPKDYALKLIREKNLPGIAGGVWSGPIIVEAPYPEIILDQVLELNRPEYVPLAF